MRRALIVLACGLVAALGAAAGPPADLGAWLALALCGLVLEYTGREDRVPLSGAFYLAAGLPGAWMLLLGGGFRLLLTRNAGLAATGLLPAALGLGLIALAPDLSLLAFAVYAGVAALVDLTRWPAYLAAAAAGLVIAQLPAYHGAALLPALALLRLPEPPLEEEEQDYGHERLRLEAHRAGKTLQAVDAFYSGVSGSKSIPQSLEHLGRSFQALAKCRSLVVFLEVEGRLEPVYALSPHRERIANARLLDLHEPVVEEAFRTRATARGGAGGEVLIPDEAHKLAIPLGREGVVYLGRERPFPGKLDLVERLARQATNTVATLRALHARDLQARQAEAAARELKAWVDMMAGLIDNTRAVADTLEPEALLERLESSLRATIPHDGGLISAGQHRRRWGVPLEPIELGRSLVIDDVPRSKFASQKVGSLMAAPLRDGCIVLASSQKDAFNRRQCDYLVMLAGLGEVFWSKALTHQRLKESQAELLQARKLAAVGRLAAGVAHEINNPLMGIQTNVDVLKPVVTDAEDRECLEEIDEGVRRCRDIVQQLLTFSRQPRGDFGSHLVSEVVKEALALLPSHPVPVTVDVGDSMVQGSRGELGQLLANLVSNARDAVAARPDGAKPPVLVRAVEEGIEVADQGIGIPEAHRGSVFDPFFTTKDVGQGTGLGLYIAYTIATNHGGSLSFESREGEGTRFLVRLP